MNQSKDSLNRNHNKNVYILFLIGILLLGLGIVFFFVNHRNDSQVEVEGEQYLQSIEIVGFSLDKEFDKNVFDYNVEVDTDEIQVKCETGSKVEGCNQSIDMSKSERLDHVIIIEDQKGNQYKYTIHITKNVKKSNKDLRISSIIGVPLEWTNKDAKIEVKADYNEDNGIWYSFDNGTTWGQNNYIIVNENRTLKIIVKNNDGVVSASKVVMIDKIDKNIPKVSINIKEKNKEKIVLEAVGIDEESGIASYSWNKDKYSSSSIKEITKPGIYTLSVKDKAGNISKEASITINDSDFGKTVEVTKTFTLTFIDNGAIVSKKTSSCTTTKDSCSIKLPDITRNGATIIGFATSKDAKSAKYKVGATIEVSNSDTLYAITKKTLKANFEKNGATSISSTSATCEAYNSETSCNLKTPTIKRDGGVVVGWSTSSLSESASYNQGVTLEVQNNMTLYAITYKTYKANFEKNGATNIGATSNSCNAYNTSSSCVLLTPSITRDRGWSYGWNTNPNATVKEVGARASIKINGNKTYYAITAIPFKANFYLNGADSMEGSQEVTCKSYNRQSSCSLIAPVIYKQGSDIVGWGSAATDTVAKYRQHENITLKQNEKFYAITRRDITVTFDENGATSIGVTELKCTAYNGKSCKVTAPSITRPGWTIYGWNVDWDADVAQYGVKAQIELNRNITLYAITKTYLYAHFDTSGLDSYSNASLSCLISNTQRGCDIVLPAYNKKGQSNMFWSLEKVGQLAMGQNHSSKYFYQAGSTYKLTSNVTFYPNTNMTYTSTVANYYKFRNFSIKKSYTIGETLFEYENGISDTTINKHIAFLKEAYGKVPILFGPAKVFVMTSNTYSNYSIAYGLTISGKMGSYANIDLKDDGGNISPNATIHELAHAWDARYGYKNGGRLNNIQKFTDFYNTKKNNGQLEKDLSKIEFFAATVTNYYWHYLCANSGSCSVNASKWYGYASTPTNTTSEANAVKNVIEPYIK